MKLIIYIPEDVYEDVKATYRGDDVLYCSVKYGTPLEDYCESCIYKPTESEDD